MTLTQTEVRVQGRIVRRPSVEISGRTIVSRGKWIKVAAVKDEEFIENGVGDDAEVLVEALRSGPLAADVFTFAQQLPNTAPKYKYHLEWDSKAVIPLTTYDGWLRGIEYDARKAIKKAAKAGVIVRPVELDDELIRGIVNIHNESSVRQGRSFWHYGKTFETVKKDKLTLLGHSQFIGAFLQDELIGFIKMVYIGSFASTLHVMSFQKHSAKKPTNALIGKAVEICHEKRLTHLVYGDYKYDGMENSLTEFKRRSGFVEILLPRYYVPLTVKGRSVLFCGLHHGARKALPSPLIKTLRAARSRFNKPVEQKTGRNGHGLSEIEH
jgi:hypothetical protein